MIDVIESTILIIVSFFQGVLGTVSGGGGGTFVVPIIVATVNENPSVLVGSVFFMYVVSSATGLVVFWRKRLVDFRTGIPLAIPTIPGVLIGTLLESVVSNAEFKIGLGALTIFLAVCLLLFKREETAKPEGLSEKTVSDVSLKKERRITDQSGRTFSYVPRISYGVILNFAAGLVAGLFGAGAAVIIVPVIILLVKMPSLIAIATSRLVLTALNVSAVLTHVGIGSISPYYALVLGTGSIVGTVLGARIAFKIKGEHLTKIIVIVLVFVGVYLLISQFA